MMGIIMFGINLNLLWYGFGFL